jgi:hypothetical protein
MSMSAAIHPVYERLVAPTEPFARHALLHDLELQLAQRPCSRALASRVRHFVERGVPYFAPEQESYRAWAAQAAHLWDEVHELTDTEPTPQLA